MLSEGAKGPIQQVEPPVLALTKLPRGTEFSRIFPFWPIVMKFVIRSEVPLGIDLDCLNRAPQN